jgi:multiple sugar transport system substrate-binding protein
MIDDTGTLYYRKSALEKAGLNPPKTFDELREVAKKLTTRQQKGLFIGNDGGISSMLTLAPISAGATIIDDKGIQFNSEMTIEAYENIAKLNKDSSLLIGSPTDWWDPSAFIQGLCLMQWGGLWAYPAIHEALKDDFGVMPWPPMKTSVSDAKPTPVTFWGGWGELANAQSKHLDAAKALIKWLWIDNTQIQIDWATGYGFHAPPRLSVAKSAEKVKSGLPSQIIQDMYQYGVILPPTWDAAMGTILTTAFSNIVKLGKDAKTEIESAAKACDAELKNELS